MVDLAAGLALDTPLTIFDGKHLLRWADAWRRVVSSCVATCKRLLLSPTPFSSNLASIPIVYTVLFTAVRVICVLPVK
ncbi:hypothetical protein EVAR_43021_1 [Eumeta japonica]|uniref:Uncharacterized protein n=1 Tax=Eumeta variegata TaxID=151549 RepID=A0A4C1XP73_EUMVA|nr:hypothetical protein EVAR_43021_1 [Eumeta japonica]